MHWANQHNFIVYWLVGAEKNEAEAMEIWAVCAHTEPI